MTPDRSRTDRRTVLVAAAAVGAGLVLTACGGSRSRGAPSPSGTGGQGASAAGTDPAPAHPLGAPTAGAPVVRVRHQRTGQVYVEASLPRDSLLEFSWVHSVEHELWREFYQVADAPDGDGLVLHLDCTEPGSFGAGTPYEAPEVSTVDGRVRYCGMDLDLPTLTWIHSHDVDHHALIDAQPFFEAADLPHHEPLEMLLVEHPVTEESP
ncbi:DUF1850 domain-containing protein [Brevibacterium litoralis]|uniref:DUF1850 domain-containing protein n=1 Tax=Brevibacterium litoralis TaxID=3138935 RepID=UPI0032ECEFBB